MMRKEKREMEVFTTCDGRVFIDKKEAEAHAEKVKFELSLEYYVISHNPDMTEGRGLYDKTVVATYGGYLSENVVMSYCFKKFGDAVVLVMGVSPFYGWTYKKVSIKSYDELKSFKEKKVEIDIGRCREKDNEIIYLNRKVKVESLDNLFKNRG